MRGSRRVRPLFVALALAMVAAVASACLPAAPSSGRGTPVRQVLLVGDSLTWGMYGTSPRIHEKLGPILADRRVGLTVAGFPGESPIYNWPGNPTWVDQVRWWVARKNPDMVIIQNTVIGGDHRNADVRARYQQGMAALMDAARSRGAHVYIVANPVAPADRQDEWRTVERIQADLARPRGISTIPVIEHMDNCSGAFIADGWHLSDKGQNCHSLAYALAVDQLRGVNG
jgi:lysophospholipase L1-like esterase